MLRKAPSRSLRRHSPACCNTPTGFLLLLLTPGSACSTHCSWMCFLNVDEIMSSPAQSPPVVSYSPLQKHRAPALVCESVWVPVTLCLTLLSFLEHTHSCFAAVSFWPSHSGFSSCYRVQRSHHWPLISPRHLSQALICFYVILDFICNFI